MLFGKQTGKISFTPLPAAIAVTLICSACSPQKGSIMIFESTNGTECTMEFKEWSAQNKCELSLGKNDELQIETSCENGEVSLSVKGKNGSRPYTGNNLGSGTFTVTVPQTDEYIITITGKNATGSLTAQNLEQPVY